MAQQNRILGVIDVGSLSVRCLIVEEKTSGALRVLGLGEEQTCNTLVAGVPTDLNQAEKTLGNAIRAAEESADCEIPEYFCGVNSREIQADIVDYELPVKDYITSNEMRTALANLNTHYTPPQRMIRICMTGNMWSVDGHRVVNPLGLRAEMLQLHALVLSIPTRMRDNLDTLLDRNARSVTDLAYMPAVGALGCITTEDAEAGVGVLDIGHQQSSLSVWRHQQLHGIFTCPMGGQHVINDVATCLRISFEEAFSLVRDHGLPDNPSVGFGDVRQAELFVEQTSNSSSTRTVRLRTAVRNVPQIARVNDIQQMVSVRCSEILMHLREQLQQKQLDGYLARGLVTLGGGAMINGFTELAQCIFGVAARRGFPVLVDSGEQYVQHACYIPAVGLARYAIEYQRAVDAGFITRKKKLWHWLNKAVAFLM